MPVGRAQSSRRDITEGRVLTAKTDSNVGVHQKTSMALYGPGSTRQGSID